MILHYQMIQIVHHCTNKSFMNHFWGERGGDSCVYVLEGLMSRLVWIKLKVEGRVIIMWNWKS